MNYLFDVLLLISLTLLAAGASYFRLRKRTSYFWIILGLTMLYRLAISFGRGRDLLGFVMDIIGLILVFFVVDIFMEHLRDKRKN